MLYQSVEVFFKDEEVNVIEEVDIVLLEPDWCHYVRDKEEHEEDMVEVDLIDSREEYSNEHKHVQICYQGE